MKFKILLFLLVGYLMTQAQNEIIHIWPDEVPGSELPKGDPVITPRDDGSTRTTEVSDPTLEVFLPDDSNRNGKAVIVCPGGGYVHLAVHKEGQTIAKWFADHGYTAFVLEYQVPNNRQGALYDIHRSFRLVRNMADKYQIDPDMVGGIGFSAGADLVARCGLGTEAVEYPEQDAADKLRSVPDRMMIIYPGYLDQGPDKSLSPGLTVSEETVPTFIFQTMDDRIVLSAFALARAMRDVGANVTLHLLPEGGHGYGMYPGNPAAEAWPGLLASWLEKHF